MSDAASDAEIRGCCASFYQSQVVRTLLGDVFHPGGLVLTHHLGQMMGLSRGDRVLDVACGRGASAVHLAQRFSCHVTGLDYGPENVAAAQTHAANRGVSQLTTFGQGQAEGLPFDETTFDAVISECSFCTFPDQATAAAEMARVLPSGGRLGLTDMTVSRPLPDDVQSLLAWVACVAGAGTPESYTGVLKAAGFTGFTGEDHREALLGLVEDVRRKQLGVELVAGLGQLDLGDLDLDAGKRLAHRALGLIEDGTVGYTLITAWKE